MSIEKTNRLVLLREIPAVYSEKRTEDRSNTVLWANAGFLNVEADCRLLEVLVTYCRFE